MKRLSFFPALLLIVLVLNSSAAKSQSNSDGSMPQFLFPDFVSGTVKMKNGQSQKALLNYNTVSGKVVYMQNENIYDLINLELVDTVSIYESRFVPLEGIFYEVLLNGQVPLYVVHKGSIVPPGKPAAYGGTSQVSSSTYMTGVQLTSGYYNLQLPADYQVKVDPVFWMKVNGTMHDFITEKQFLKLLPEKQQELKAFIKKYRIRFGRIPEVKKLAGYVNELMQ